jgi:transcriptional regulator with XRE-family HTH domain
VRLGQAIGHTLREIRTDRGFTLTDLSQASHISIAHISDIERSRTVASPDMIECLASGLQVKTSDLMLQVYKFLKENE